MSTSETLKKERKAKKRGNGEGTIRQLNNGSWEARVMIGYNKNGKPKFKTFQAKQRGIVQKKLADYIANKKSSEPEVASRNTTAQWLKNWLVEYVAINVKTLTRSSYEGIVNNHIIPNIGSIKLNELKKVDIENMYSKLLSDGKGAGKGGLSVKPVKNVALCLHKALGEAFKHEYIIKNPASIANVPTMRSTNGIKKEIEILTKQEQKDLIAVCDNSAYGMGIFTTMNTGVRIGELLAIMWSDIDFDKKTLTITKQLNRARDYSTNAKARTRLGIQDDTKTKSSVRTISLNEILIKRLLEYKEQQDAQRKKWGTAYNNLDMVFARNDGYYIDPATYRDNYIKKLKEAGLKQYTFHSLRHTFATRALEAGIAIKVVSQILGHATVQITMDTYQHVLPDLQSEAMNRIADYMYS
jgi:integrase